MRKREAVVNLILMFIAVLIVISVGLGLLGIGIIVGFYCFLIAIPCVIIFVILLYIKRKMRVHNLDRWIKGSPENWLAK
jgi:hypothetical protein